MSPLIASLITCSLITLSATNAQPANTTDIYSDANVSTVTEVNPVVWEPVKDDTTLVNELRSKIFHNHQLRNVDDHFLLKFLKARDNDVNSALKLLLNYVKYLTEHRELFPLASQANNRQSPPIYHILSEVALDGSLLGNLCGVYSCPHL